MLKTSLRFFLFIALLIVIHAKSHSQWKPEGIPVMDTSTSSGYLYPEIVTDNKGGCYVIWGDPRNQTDINIFVQHLDHTGKELFPHNGIPVETAPYFQQLNHCLSDGKGGIFFTWSDARDQIDDYIYAQYMDSSGNLLWQTNGVKAMEPAGLGAQVVTDGAGGIIINCTNVYGITIQRLDSMGHRMWGDSGISQSDSGLSVEYWLNASDDKGGVIVSWIQGSAIYAQRVRHDGSVAWKQNGIRLTNVDNSYATLSIVDDHLGGAIVCWSLADFSAVFAQRVDSAGNLLWGVSGVRVGSGGLPPGYIVSDQRGGAIIPTGSPGKFELYRLRSDGSNVWGNGVALNPNVGVTYFVSDSASGVIYVYNGNKNSSNWTDILAQRVDSSGVIRWNLTGVPVANFSSDKENPEAVSDGMGGVIAVWDDLRNYPSPQSSVYAGKVDSAGKATTGVKRENTLHVPNSFSLSQNYPNPFNPTTIIDYQLPVTSFVTLRVYDILGREVAMLVHEKKEPGDYVVSLDGGRFSSGVYFYRLTADNATITRKMVIVH